MYLYFLFYTTMSECMIFYGPTVPEINYSILFYSIERNESVYNSIATLYLMVDLQAVWVNI